MRADRAGLLDIALISEAVERLAADAPGMERLGAGLIGYYLARVIAQLACEHITARPHASRRQRRPTVGEGARLRRCISALVSAGITR